MECPSCGGDSPLGAKFCAEGGARLAGSSSSGPLSRSPADAERRQLTCLFCDLESSVELSARLDPEDLRQVLAAYQQVCASVVRRFEGHVARYFGDGILVYFGFPTA